MFTQALEIAFKTKLKAYATTAQIAVDWGDEIEYDPIKEPWLRPRLNPFPTAPGPTNRGRFMGTMRGLYSVECMTPKESGHAAAYALADAVALYFFPATNTPQILPSDDCVIRLEAMPSADRLPPFEIFNRAVAHIPYLVYAFAA